MEILRRNLSCERAFHTFNTQTKFRVRGAQVKKSIPYSLAIPLRGAVTVLKYHFQTLISRVITG